MDWDRGFSAEYYITVVDPVTWRDTVREEIRGGSIKKELSGLLQSADIEKDKSVTPDASEKWIRVWLNATQSGSTEHVALFTGLASCPEFTWKGFYPDNSYECYSVLKPCQDILLQRGWYAQAGTHSVSLIYDLLTDTTDAPVIAEQNSKRLQSSIIAEDGESYLSMVQKILVASDLRIIIDGKGQIHVEPTATDVKERFEYKTNDIVEPSITVKHDWYNCPNVFRAVDDDMTAIARDDSPDSLLSTVSRGREIWQEETNCDLADDENIAEYAERRLKEEQASEMSVSYRRRFLPELEPTDIVRLHYPELQIDGVFQITSQSIELSHGAFVTEEVTSWKK